MAKKILNTLFFLSSYIFASDITLEETQIKEIKTIIYWKHQLAEKHYEQLKKIQEWQQIHKSSLSKQNPAILELHEIIYVQLRDYDLYDLSPLLQAYEKRTNVTAAYLKAAQYSIIFTDLERKVNELERKINEFLASSLQGNLSNI